MTRFACFAAACALVLAVAPAEPYGVGPRGRPGGGGGGPGPAPRPATPAFTHPMVPAGGFAPRPMAPSPGFVPSRPSVPPLTRPAAPTGMAPHPGRPPVTMPNAPTVVRPTPVEPGRPSQFNRPGPVTRPQVNRTNTNRTPNVTVNHWGGANRQFGAPRTWFSQTRNWNRTWWGGRPAWNWGRPWYWQHARWHHGFWNFWRRPPALWFGGGLFGGWILSPGDTFGYVNPYYVAGDAPPVSLSYSHPLPVVPAEEEAMALPPDPDELSNATDPPTAPTDSQTAEANRLLDSARAAFRAGEYAKAQELVTEAIRLVPSDPTLHEVRARSLFAQGKYQDATAALYSVLTAGPGWDWPTMRDLLPDTDTYTAQLRALERFVTEHPNAAYSYFLLAYHYLVTEHRDAAVRELREVVRLQPDDKLAQALLTSLTSADSTAGPPPLPGR